MPSAECHDDDDASRRVHESELATTVARALIGLDGTVIDHYQLIQKIGEGGMGEVWLAEQKEPVRRRVALKLIKAGMNSREVIARFESERQALALMNHPAIAKVLDAGSTPQGLPYFVMEYVAGAPVTTYCDNHRLSIRERLELFIAVCEGVQHAHQKAIIHRDLKPANVLVTEVDGKPAPKIIDFGVAKALTHKLTAGTLFTRVGAIVGTPEYMSPEQALSSDEDIDTRTDVYSLGIILYQLLAGAPPIELRNIALDEWLRRLREDDAPKLSARIRTQAAATSTELARKRKAEPRSLAKQMRGDLDSIALKALEKDRSRRYNSASEFAEDIGRYLRNETVLAMPASAAYRIRKFTRRHRWGVATACAFALVLVAATVISVQQSLRASRQAAEAQAMNDFLQNDLLAQASTSNQSAPGAKPDPDLKVRTALDRAAVRIGSRFERQPELEASIRDTIGQAYRDLGLYSEARKQLERSLEQHRRVLGEKDPKTAKTMSLLAGVANQQGQYAEAESLLGKALEIQRRVVGPKHPDTLRSMWNLAYVYENEHKYEQARALYSQTLEIQRQVLGIEHPNTLNTMNDLGSAYYLLGNKTQAETLYRQVLEIRRRTLGPEHPSTLASMANVAMVLPAAEEEALERELLEIERRVLGPEHPDTLITMNNLAGAYNDQGKYSDAEVLRRQVLEIRRRMFGPAHPATLRSVWGLASILDRQGKSAEAEALYRGTLESVPNEPNTLNGLAWHLLSVPDRRRRRPQEALQLARRSIQLPPEEWYKHGTLGLAQYRNGMWPEAIASLNRAVEMNKGKNAANLLILAMAYWKHGDQGAAERFFQQGVNEAGKGLASEVELRMCWGEAAELFGKPGPLPTILEAQAEPERVMETLKRGIAARRFQTADLQISPDLAPLRGRADFKALLRTATPARPAQ